MPTATSILPSSTSAASLLLLSSSPSSPTNKIHHPRRRLWRLWQNATVGTKIVPIVMMIVIVCFLSYSFGGGPQIDRVPAALSSGWPLSVPARVYHDTKVCLSTMSSRAKRLEHVITYMKPLGSTVEVSTDLSLRLSDATVNRVRDLGPATKYMCTIDNTHDYYLVVDDENLYRPPLTHILRDMIDDRCDIAAGSTWNADGLLDHPSWNWYKGHSEPDTQGKITVPRGACGILVRRSLMSIIQRELRRYHEAEDDSCKFSDDVLIGLIAFEFKMTICSISNVMKLTPSWLSCGFYVYRNRPFNKGDVDAWSRRRYDDNIKCLNHFMKLHPTVAARMMKRH